MDGAEAFMQCAVNHYTGDLGMGGVMDGLKDKGGFGKRIQIVGNKDDPEVPFAETEANVKELQTHEFFTQLMQFKLSKSILSNPKCAKHQVGVAAFPEQYRYYLCNFWNAVF